MQPGTMLRASHQPLTQPRPLGGEGVPQGNFLDMGNKGGDFLRAGNFFAGVGSGSRGIFWGGGQKWVKNSFRPKETFFFLGEGSTPGSPAPCWLSQHPLFCRRRLNRPGSLKNALLDRFTGHTGESQVIIGVIVEGDLVEMEFNDVVMLALFRMKPSRS